MFRSLAGGLPFAVFLVGAFYDYEPEGSTWKGTAVGGVVGAVGGLVAMMIESRLRLHREAMAEDED